MENEWLTSEQQPGSSSTASFPCLSLHQASEVLSSFCHVPSDLQEQLEDSYLIWRKRPSFADFQLLWIKQQTTQRGIDHFWGIPLMAKLFSLLKAFCSSAANILPLITYCYSQCQEWKYRCPGTGLVLHSVEMKSLGRLCLAFWTALNSWDRHHKVAFSAWLLLLTWIFEISLSHTHLHQMRIWPPLLGRHQACLHNNWLGCHPKLSIFFFWLWPSWVPVMVSPGLYNKYLATGSVAQHELFVLQLVTQDLVLG